MRETGYADGQRTDLSDLANCTYGEIKSNWLRKYLAKKISLTNRVARMSDKWVCFTENDLMGGTN